MATEKVSKPSSFAIKGPTFRRESGTNKILAKLRVDIDKNKKHYISQIQVVWSYKVKGGGSFPGESTTVDAINKWQETSYTPPEAAVSLTCKVTVVSAEYDKEYTEKKNGKEVKRKKKVKYLNLGSKAMNSSASYNLDVTQAEVSAPNTPDVSDSSGGILMFRCNVDTTYFLTVNQIQFEVLKGNSQVVYAPYINLTPSGVNSATAYGLMQMDPGWKYKVRARKAASGKVWDDLTQWSSYSSEVSSVPGMINFEEAIAYSDKRVFLRWVDGGGATDGFEIQYTDDESLFDGASDLPSFTQVAGMDSVISPELDNTGGKTWYFRIRGKNSSGYGAWSNHLNCKLATVPSAPSTWQYAAVVKQGEDMVLNWTHNSEDNSKQTAAQVGYKIGSAAEATHDETTATLWNIATAGITDGTTVKWRVRTKGAHDNWGEWSDYKEFRVVAAPGVEVPGGIPPVISTFPVNLTITATPATQSVLSIAVTITADKEYSTLDDTGLGTVIPAGGIIYQGFFDNLATNTLEFSLTPGDVQLDTGESYTMTITVYMDSGLNGSTSGQFTAEFALTDFIPSADITYDYGALVTYITPSCSRMVDNPDYDPDHDDRGEPMSIFAEYKDVYFDIFRLEYDGSFTTIAENVDGELGLTVSDPHPSLNIPRYRVVAKKKDTGQMTYQDVICDEVGYQSVVIQWDEQWQTYSGTGYESEDDASVTGSRLELPYDIDIQAQNAPDVALVEYIGRRAPVSYYGTQKGESGTWKIDLPDDDENSLFAIRRLANWSGDVYIREPSGLGYWAHVEVSYSKTYNKRVIPVTMKVTRVDGGA